MSNTQIELLKRITMDPNMLFGKPSIRGMRYPLKLILDLLSSGMTNEEILEDYANLEAEDIQACLLIASQLLNIDSIVSMKVDVA